jgi:hypothetical protein
VNQPDSTAKNTPKIAEVQLSSCWFEVADFRKIVIVELRSLGCRAIFLWKAAEFWLRKCFLQVAELRLRTQKKVARAHLWRYQTNPVANSCGPLVTLMPLLPIIGLWP